MYCLCCEYGWYVLKHPEVAIKTTEEGVQGQPDWHTKIAPSFASEKYRVLDF